MKSARMIVSKDFKIGKTSNELFGSFIEHMGCVVYNGIYEPDHPQADKNGFRKDVLELIRDLKLSVIRYPGGNFTSGYNWEDGIGPKENRKPKLDLAWRAIEPNSFGLDEFMKWIKIVGAEPIMTVNLGTRGADEARNIIEYCNFLKGGYWSDLRRKHGILEPYGIKRWCLGNELDGEWQITKRTADEYGKIACETAKVMKWVDPNIELVAVGSSSRSMKSFPEWDKTVLMNTYQHVDYISLHNYIDKKENDTPTYLAMSLDMEKQIKEVISTCDYVKSNKRSNKTMLLSFDEWNIHKNGEKEYIPWQTGSPIDWVRFNMEDALVFGSAMLIILRNCDRIKIACQALLVNTIPMILTEKGGLAWRNATFYPFMHVSKYGRGEVLLNVIETPKYDTKTYCDVPVVDSVAVYNEMNNELNVFAINRSTEPLCLKIDIRDFSGYKLKDHIILKNDNLFAVNTEEKPFEIRPTLCNNTKVDDGYAESILEKYSWNVIRFNVIEQD